MGDLTFSELIITCEACGNVKKFRIKNETDTENQIREYQCENGCGKNLLSFIQVGQLMLEQDLEETTVV